MKQIAVTISELKRGKAMWGACWKRESIKKNLHATQKSLRLSQGPAYGLGMLASRGAQAGQMGAEQRLWQRGQADGCPLSTTQQGPAQASRSQSSCSSGSCHIAVLTNLTSPQPKGPNPNRDTTGATSHPQEHRENHNHYHLTPPTRHPSSLLRLSLPPSWRAQLRSSFSPAGNLIRSIN